MDNPNPSLFADPQGLQNAQNQVHAWIQQYGVRYFDPLTNNAVLMEEVGEMSRIMARTYGEQSFKTGESAEQLGSEMADVLWVLLCLANQCGIDLEHELQENLAKKTSRDQYRHLDNPKLKP
ncbi:MAG: nucleotide pyrophosphohydrolase [Sphingomonadales bacterium]|nr:nucleotide pyrophosphohydrolase [Sphingomonadales bacterium]